MPEEEDVAQKLRELITLWERGGHSVNDLLLRSAAQLSRYDITDEKVLRSLDRSRSPEKEVFGARAYRVVRELRRRLAEEEGS